MSHPDAKLLKLGAEFEFAVVNFQRDCAKLDADRVNLTPAEIDETFEEICGRLEASRDAVTAAHAKTLAGFQVKARAAAWPYSEKDGTYFPALEDKVVRSIIADLLAITGPKVCIGAVPDNTGKIVPLFAGSHEEIDNSGIGRGTRKRLHADLSAQCVARDIVLLNRRPVPRSKPNSQHV